MLGKSSQVTLTKKFAIASLILVLVMASYHAIQRTRSYLVNNAIEFKLSKAKKAKNSFDEYPAIAQLIDHGLAITKSNPRTYLLAGNVAIRRLANNTVHSEIEFQQVLSQAENYYVIGLKLQPDNPFLWVNLALVAHNQPEQKGRFENAVKMAKKYGGSHPEVKEILARF